jgi:1,2-diacylglycerol 3-alpha-glucosyltransferase
MRPAIVIKRIGPYHAARLEELGRRLNGKVLVLETYNQDITYDWALVDKVAFSQRRTLFRTIRDRRGWADLERRTNAALDSWSPTVVAIPGWADPAALAGLLWCQWRGIPSIILSDSTLEDAPRVWWRERIKRAVLRNVDAGFVAGRRHKTYLSNLGLPPERIEEGYDVVDNQHFTQGAELARRRGAELRLSMGLPTQFFLTVCRFVAKKNLAALLDAYALYRAAAGEAAWPLVVVGDGPEQAALARRAAAPDLAGLVLLRPFAQYDCLPAYYGLASAFILASVSDQWGLVVNEAMAAGLPVLVSRHCGCFEDLVVEGENGFGFDPLNVAEIANRLRLVAHGGVNLARFGAAGARRISAWSSWLPAGLPIEPSTTDRDGPEASTDLC